MKKLLSLFIILTVAVIFVACTGEKPPVQSESKPEPHEHSFGEWQTITPATCTAKGLDERVCECGKAQQMITPEAPHNYVDTVIPPTCISSGYTEHVCECGDKYTDTVTKTDVHTYDASKSVTAPTYDKEGYTTYICHCGMEKIDDYTAALKNDPSALPLSELYVVVPEKLETTLLHSTDKLLFSAKSLSGKTLKSGRDTGNSYELLLGNTGRPESTALISELSNGEFALRMVGNKLVIAAKNDVFLHEAVELLVKTYLEPQKNDGKNPILIPSSTNIVMKGNVHSLYYTMMNGNADLLFSSTAAHTLTNEKYYRPGENYETHIYRRQGGTFNGKMVYQALISVSEELAVIAGKNIETGETIYSEPRPMGHANDVTYNPITNKVYACNSGSVHVFDADTLEYIETIDSAVSGSGIHFAPERNVFLFKGGLGFSTASADLSEYIESVFTSKITGYTSQGICADDTFIYFLLCKGISGSKYTTHLAIYDWYGNFIRFMTIQIESNHEPENISVVDGQIYIGACTSQPVFTQFRVDLESMQTTDTSVGDVESEEVVFNETAEAKKAFTHVNDFAADNADPRIHRRRASFFDGTYFYQTYVNTAGDLGVIAKKNVRTGEVIYSEPRNIDHARGVAYNTKNNTIVISGKTKTLYVFNAKSLQYLKQVKLSFEINSIAYNESTNEYVCLTGKEVVVLNSSFKEQSRVTIKVPTGFSAHAMTVDSEGVMHVLYLKNVGSERYTYCVGLYDYGASTYKKLIAYDLPDNIESPGISVVNGTIYVSGCTPIPEVTLYKLNIK